jgi:hypothetical protein
MIYPYLHDFRVCLSKITLPSSIYPYSLNAWKWKYNIKEAIYKKRKTLYYLESWFLRWWRTKLTWHKDREVVLKDKSRTKSFLRVWSSFTIVSISSAIDWSWDAHDQNTSMRNTSMLLHIHFLKKILSFQFIWLFLEEKSWNKWVKVIYVY